MEFQTAIGTPVPWYRVNGWIPQNGGPDWMRYQLCVLGFRILSTPLIYVGDLDAPISEPPKTTRKTIEWTSAAK